MNKEEKQYMRILVQRELDRFNKEESLPCFGDTIPFAKAAHEYRHFLEQLLEKLKDE